jgi:predicted nucleic acid-binding protein
MRTSSCMQLPPLPFNINSRNLLDSDLPLCVAPQVLAEFYAVATDRRRVTVPFTPTEAGAFITELVSRVEVLSVPASVVNRWIKLAEQHAVSGSDVFDVQLAATMLENGISRIYTYNRIDFERFAELHVLAPE